MLDVLEGFGHAVHGATAYPSTRLNEGRQIRMEALREGIWLDRPMLYTRTSDIGEISTYKDIPRGWRLDSILAGTAGKDVVALWTIHHSENGNRHHGDAESRSDEVITERLVDWSETQGLQRIELASHAAENDSDAGDPGSHVVVASLEDVDNPFLQTMPIPLPEPRSESGVMVEVSLQPLEGPVDRVSMKVLGIRDDGEGWLHGISAGDVEAPMPIRAYVVVPADVQSLQVRLYVSGGGKCDVGPVRVVGPLKLVE
jgi:hypothetical protein